METVPEVRYFSWTDYTVFSAMLIGSTAIGLYHGCSWRFTSNKSSGPTRNDSGEFLTANGQMSAVPVAVSMLAGWVQYVTYGVINISLGSVDLYLLFQFGVLFLNDG